MILRKLTRTGKLSVLKAVLVLVHLFSLPEVITAEAVYPDGGRNAIPLIRNKHTRPQPYNDGTVMAHVVGSAGMNFLYYFHILGVACENADRKFYRIIQNDFEFCLNKTGPLPPQLRNKPLGSIPISCVDWKLHRPCYKNLADDYDECLVNKPGLIKKGTDALRFTHAYAKFICGNFADTEAHLLERYTKHNMMVDGVFQCFPHLQDRIVNCIKKDKVSKTLCSKFFIVHACFGKYYNDDNCHDVQPIYYMDDMFRNMSTSLSCPGKDEHWYPINPTGPTHRPPTGGWPSTEYPPTKGWSSERPTKGWSSERPTKGWSSREEHSYKENPWPGEQGRPWSIEREREPFIRGDQRYPERQPTRPTYSSRGQDWRTTERERIIPNNDRNRFSETHANRPYPDKHWNNRPWIDVLDRGSSTGRPWGQRKNELGPTRGRGDGISSSRGSSSHEYDSNSRVSSGERERERGRYIDRGGSSSERGRYIDRGGSSAERGRYKGRGGSSSDERGLYSDRRRGGGSSGSGERERNDNQRFYYSSSSTPRGGGGQRQHVVVLPPAGFARTRTPKEVDVEEDEADDNVDGDQKYYTIRQSSLAPKTSNDDLGYNFFSFE